MAATVIAPAVPPPPAPVPAPLPPPPPPPPPVAIDVPAADPRSSSAHLLRVTRYALTAGAWVAAQMSTTWWAYELGVLNATRPAVGTTSVVLDDFAGMGVATAWLVAATVAVAGMGLTLLAFARAVGAHAKAGADATWMESVTVAFAGNACALLAAAAVAVPYAWTVATLPTLGPVLAAHAPNISNLALQHVALASTLVFCATWGAWVHTTQTQTRRIVRSEMDTPDKSL